MTYDCFSFFNELDILEIRLNVLNEYVDYFVIGESKQTFSNKAKPLHYLENKSKFEKWNHKIIHVEHPILTKYRDSFDIAAFQKDNLKKGLIDAKDEDTIYFGDVDEIWKPKEIDNLQLLQMIADSVGKTFDYKLVPSDRSGHDITLPTAPDLIYSLGWTAPYTVEQRMQQTVNWYRANPDWLE
jgi:beta-1,4-mannosyl-glycoprotein beta-1,4-N-acetylglucosaminyltransferase